MSEVRSWAGRVLAWVVILSMGCVLLAAVVIPRLAGATPYTVLSGSMRPDLPPGTLVVVRPTDFEGITVGDRITYQLESGESTVATHRVVAVTISLDGERTLQTRGDANGAPDAEPVREEQVRGAVWYSIPHLGHLNTALTRGGRQLAVYVVAAGLLGYAAFMFTAAVRERPHRGAAT